MKTQGNSGRLAAAVAGDDENAKETVMIFVDQVGFDPVDAGSLEESWRQQPSKRISRRCFPQGFSLPLLSVVELPGARGRKLMDAASREAYVSSRPRHRNPLQQRPWRIKVP